MNTIDSVNKVNNDLSNHDNINADLQQQIRVLTINNRKHERLLLRVSDETNYDEQMKTLTAELKEIKREFRDKQEEQKIKDTPQMELHKVLIELE